MNIKQMKAMVSRFRKADFSAVADPVMRAKAQKLQAKQKGFTLLELLVVITLLAILATGALVAYDGAGDKAQSSKAANTTAVLDQGVRAYRAVTQAYPNQWDNLSNPDSAGPAVDGDFIPAKLQRILGSINFETVMAASAVNYAGYDNLQEYFEETLGMDEIQHVRSIDPGVAPNRAHNEGTNLGGAEETDIGEDYDFISILASQARARSSSGGADLDCQVGGISMTATWDDGDGNPGVADPDVINSINDALSTERCNLVLALGFGGDAAQSTINSSAGVIQAPTYSSPSVNPSEKYSRYVGLFLLATGEKTPRDIPYTGAAGDGISDLTADNFLKRPRLLGFIDTEGNTIDANIAAATQN